jgi:hypothetical protein
MACDDRVTGRGGRRWATAAGATSLALVAIACGSGAQQASDTTTGSGAGASTSSSSGATTGASSSSSGGTTSSSGSSSSGATGVTGVVGNTLDALSFSIVGDTRPPITDDTAGYPTPIITTIWKDIAAASPPVAFGVGTGDYMFALNQASQQLALYNGARAAFKGLFFPAMGNHECSWLGLTTSNCGPGNADGTTANYTTFLSTMLAPFKVDAPYYTVDIASSSASATSWTAKMVFIAANAWDVTQATWLGEQLAKPTTYTFVIRHESVNANTAPGVTPSEAILAKYPWTLKIVGHTHTYQYSATDREVMVGNGGAPLSGTVNYGYTIARQRADGAIVFNSYDYMTNAVVDTFAVKADGTPTQ